MEIQQKNETTLDSREITHFQTLDGKPYEIPIEGSLGLLALGHVGLIAWRHKRNQAKLVNTSTEGLG